MLNEIYSDFLGHAHAQAPHECCGVVVQNGAVLAYHRCRNVDEFPARQFTLHPEDWAAAEDCGAVVAVCHSHINQSAQPSEADLLGCEQTGLPWLIVSLLDESVVKIEPCGYQPDLVGRPFVWGVFDCATLVIDYFKSLGITMKPHSRYDYNFWQQGLDLLPVYLQAGFVPVADPPREHDVFLINLRADTCNHAAIYIGDDKILHHVEQRLSERVVYGGFWQKNTRHVLRHGELC